MKNLMMLLAFALLVPCAHGGDDDPITPTTVWQWCGDKEVVAQAFCITYLRGVIDALNDEGSLVCSGSHQSFRLAYIHAVKERPAILNHPSASLAVLDAMVREEICMKGPGR